MDIHGCHGYPSPLLDMYGYGYGGYPNGYPKWISMLYIHVYYGYPTCISCLDIHDIHDIQSLGGQNSIRGWTGTI